MSNKYQGDPPSAPIDEQSHSTIQALLYEYVSAQVQRQKLHRAWRPFERHLQNCPSCRRDADALLQLMRASYNGEITQHDQPYAPDLWFLTSSVVTIEPRTKATHTTANTIVIEFSLTLLPAMRVALVARSSSERLRYSYRLPPENLDSPDITVELFTHEEHSERGLVRVTVELPHRDPFAQEGSEVMLAADGLSLSAVTDHNGVASFSDVPLDQMARWRISVTPPASSMDP